MTEIFSGKRRELCRKWRRTWQATEETGKKLTRAREKLWSQPACPGEAEHHTYIEDTFLRFKELSSSSIPIQGRK